MDLKHNLGVHLSSSKKYIKKNIENFNFNFNKFSVIKSTGKWLYLRNIFQFSTYSRFILLHEKFLQFDWRRRVVFQLNLKYPHFKITNPLGEQIISWFVRDIWHKYHSWYFKIVPNFARLTARETTYNNFEMSLLMPNLTTTCFLIS